MTLEDRLHWRTVLLSASEKPIERILAAARTRMPETIGWRDARWIYLGIDAFRTEIASGMPVGLAARLLNAANLLVPGGERNSYQYRLPRRIDRNRARLYCCERQRVEGG